MSTTYTDRIDGLTTSVAIKAPCHFKTTGHISLSGLAVQANGGWASELSSGDRIFASNQANSVDNGIWVAAQGAWSRAKDFDGNRDVVQGTLVMVYQASGLSPLYRCTTPNPVVIGSSALTFDEVALGFDPDQLETQDLAVVDNIAGLKAVDKTSYTRAFVVGYYAAGDGGGGHYWYDSSDASSTDNGGSVIVATDGARWKLVRNGSLSVKQFGARGNGVNDDTLAINKALTAAEDGETIEFPAPDGDYRVSGALSVNKRIRVRGAKTKIKSTAGNVFDILYEGAVVEGFVLEGSRVASSIGVRIGANIVILRDMQISHFNKGIEVWGGVWQRVEHIRLENIMHTVIEVGNVVGTVVEDLRYNTQVPTYAQPTYGVHLFGEGCNFSDLDLIHAGTACYITPTASRDSTWNFFNSCSFDTSTYGLRISNTFSGHVVKGIMFDHCWFSSHAEAGILIDPNYSCSGITFTDCYVINNAKYGVDNAEASEHVAFAACVFGGNSAGTTNTHPNIRHGSLGRLYVKSCHFGSWGLMATVATAAIARTSTGGQLFISDSYSETPYNTVGLSDASANSLELGINFGNLDSAAGGSGDGIPNSTSLSSANIAITSSSTTNNTIQAVSSGASAVRGTTSSLTGFGGVFANTAGGAGLRVDQGSAQFAGNASVDGNLAVTGTSTLSGAVAGAGFNSSVDARIASYTLTGLLANSTTQSNGNLNIASSSTTSNTVRAVSSGASAVQGISSSLTGFGAVFSNTAGGAGLRVDQGSAQFAGAAQVDGNLGVSGTTTLSGSVAGTGFNSSVDSRVTYSTLNGNGAVGTGATQVARGNHTHTKASLDVQDLRLVGFAGSTDANGRITVSHGLGYSPSSSMAQAWGGADNVIGVYASTSTTITVEVRRLDDGTLRTSTGPFNFMVLVGGSA